MFQALKSLFTTYPAKQQAHDAYVRIVTQSRQPFFYSDWQVPDTVDGRFDMVILHLFLVMSRLQEDKHNIEGTAFARELAEVFFADMDRSLREMGSSDTGVGKRVKKMAQAFYGRIQAYEAAGGDREEMMEAIRRNIYREQPVPTASVQAFANYAERNRKHLEAQPMLSLMEGNIQFLG
jgi:cytochrome b pre-mRNA-processing protein 3